MPISKTYFKLLRLFLIKNQKENIREPNEDLIGISFDEYKNKMTKNKGLKSKSYEMIEEISGKDYKNFLLKTRYYWDCYENLNTKKENIINLSYELLKINKDNSPNEMQDDLLTLATLMVDAGISKERREQFDQKLMKEAINYFNSNKENVDFNKLIEEAVNWYFFRIRFYNTIEIGSTEYELNFLKEIFYNNQIKFEEIKNKIPYLYLNFIKCVIWLVV